MAARISQPSLPSEDSKALAEPWKLPCTLAGMAISFCACAISFTARPRDEPRATSNEIVTAGNCPWWFKASVVGAVSKCETAESGTMVAPVVIAGEVLPADGVVDAPPEVEDAGLAEAEVVVDSAGDPVEERAPADDAPEDEGALSDAT